MAVSKPGYSLACLVVLVAALLGCTLPRAATATSLPAVATAQGLQEAEAPGVAANPLGYSLTPSTTEPYAVCGPPTPGHFGCTSIIVPPGATRKLSPLGPLSEVSPTYEGSGEGGGFSPSDLRSAYKLSETGGSGQTVAIVDAYNDPKAEANLAVYRTKYGLSACTRANGCFKKVNQKGESSENEEASLYPSSKYPVNERTGEIENWGLEISLDLDMVSAVCPECKILLVEAVNNEKNEKKEYNLDIAEDEAATLKATEISNSWNGEERSEETSEDKNFEHSGIPITVASGDSGYGAGYPASSKDVIAVGGTTLQKAEGPRGWSETVWEGSGSGCSTYESKPVWQTDPACAKRTDNDVAAVANPFTPVSIYDSYEASGWTLLGGTSVATPILAGIEAHASEAVRKEGAEAFYRHTLFDVTSGTNGGCGGTYLCTGEEGYDGPTGWGTPDGPLELAAGYHVITQSAIGITPTAATLTGYVNPEGAETTYYFEYGKTTSYGTTVPVPSGNAGSGVIWKGVSQSITGLEREATYHYRLVGHNSSGTLDGKDHTVTTSFWSVSKTPSVGDGTLWGASCTSTDECMAVGQAEGKSLSELWNLLEWKVKTTPNPTGAIQSSLEGVSCWAASACIAVGEYENSSKVDVTLAERWNGTEWSIQSTPNPTGAKQSQLESVSCGSATACTAVGWYINSSGTRMALAERWNGTEWSIQSTPTTSTAGGFERDEVSCASSSACTAVRKYGGIDKNVTVVERWNGTAWSIQTFPTPESGGHTAVEFLFNGVSCPSSTECTAVGVAYYATNEDEPKTLAEHWNGTEWQTQPTPNPSGFNDLRTISCISSTACTAAGQTGNEVVFAERWNGTEWVIQTMPSSPSVGGIGSLEGVSCIEPLQVTCMAVGLAGGVPLVESESIPQRADTEAATEVTETEATLNGTVNPAGQETKYYFEYGPTTSYGSKTSEIGAGSGTSGVKVNHTLTGLTPGTYHFRVVATSSAGPSYGADVTFKAATPTWRITSTPNPSETLHSYLWGVSCRTASECMGVGSYDATGTGERPLAERWNGSEWKVKLPGVPTEATLSELYGVSCGASESCLMVGTYLSKAGVYYALTRLLLLGSWFATSPKEPSGTLDSLLDGASCTAAVSCMTVGWYEPSPGVEIGFSDQLNESLEWTVHATPSPSGAADAYPAAVSCTSQAACTMVGYYKNSSGTKLPFAERWNGTEWNLQSVPSPTGAIRTELKGVSCTSSSACTAVGAYWLSTGGGRPLAERWTGTEWTIQSVPQPSETTSNTLTGVSCASGSTCMATGVSQTTSEIYVPLAEQWNGTGWLAQKPPVDGEGNGGLWGGVSCPEARYCAALGNFGKGFAEIYG